MLHGDILQVRLYTEVSCALYLWSLLEDRNLKLGVCTCFQPVCVSPNFRDVAATEAGLCDFDFLLPLLVEEWSSQNLNIHPNGVSGGCWRE